MLVSVIPSSALGTILNFSMHDLVKSIFKNYWKTHFVWAWLEVRIIQDSLQEKVSPYGASVVLQSNSRTSFVESLL